MATVDGDAIGSALIADEHDMRGVKGDYISLCAEIAVAVVVPVVAPPPLPIGIGVGGIGLVLD